MKKTLFLSVPVLVALLAGCSEAPNSEGKKEAGKAVAPVTGQSALFKMYQVARAWSADIEILKMNSIILSEVPQVPGEAGAWEATFVSPSKGLRKSWTYSVIEAQGSLHEGVFGGSEYPWSATIAEPPFLIEAVKKDTDAAYETAKAKAGNAAAKNAGKPISFLLESTTKYAHPVWRVIWGESVGTANLSVFVDATTGECLETLH
ncbi:MAG: hypothetical protein ABSC23_00580 [Bryobacteraceae bacterium]|jgi:hypothetical protein